MSGISATEPAPDPFEYDADTAVEPLGEGSWAATVSPRWSIGPHANGGYALGLALSAATRVVPHPDPFAVSAHFLRPTVPGPAEIATEPLRAGRAHSTAVARLFQEGRERLHVVTTFGDLDSLAGGLDVMTAGPPELPPPDECRPLHRGTLPNGLRDDLRGRLDARVAPGTAGWLDGAPSGRGELLGWVRFRDGRPPDAACLPFVCDAMPPAAFDLTPVPAWLPTIELTVQVRGRPHPGWLRCRYTTRFILGGYLEEDAEIWDQTDRLVALSRQLARMNRPRD
ncbi:MAG TPA: thioesterase family protein [Candidatus Dormibacteraeota bacterium]|nr:thioesterase family protein [Candidatus Dormibacteraeota bacterium]